MASAAATKRLTAEFTKLVDAPVPGILARPINEANMAGKWSFTIAGPPDSPYEFGVFTGTLQFPADYPLSPPKMVFEPPITHPNVYGTGGRRGEVCISILHAGADSFGYERIEERWSPVQSVRSILLSVMSMLCDVNVESPANVEAAVLFSRHPDKFRQIVQAEVERSLGIGAGMKAASTAGASSTTTTERR